MSGIKFATLMLTLVLLANPDVQCQAENFARPLSLLLNSRHEMVKALVSIKKNVDQYDGLQRYIKALEDLQRNVKKFMKASLSTAESKQLLLTLKAKISSISLPEALYKSYTLKKEYAPIKTFWSKMETEINALLTRDGQHHVIPLSTICPSRLSLRNISTALVCKNSLSCARNGKPYSTVSGWTPQRTEVELVAVSSGNMDGTYGGRRRRPSDRTQYFPDRLNIGKITKTIPPRRIYGHEDNLKNGCTRDGNQCNVTNALPIMTGIFWHEVDYMITQKLCPQSCSSNNCNYANNEHVLDEAAILTIYAKIHPKFFETTWNKFIADFQRKKGFNSIEEATSVAEAHYKDLKTFEAACTRLKFYKACPYANVYNSYNLVHGAVQRNKKARRVKDLRLYANMDHAKIIELQKDAMKHIKVLTSIKALDENLKTSVSGMSKYFQGVAKFEESIANADASFIKGELAKYEAQLPAVQRELKEKIRRAMKLMMTLVTVNLAEKVSQLAIFTLQESNPLKVIFNGVDASAMLEKSGEIADASSQVVKGTALIKSLSELTKDSLKLSVGFNQNKKQLSSLENVVNKIRHGKSSSIGEDAERFIKEYNNYSPKVSQSDIAKNNALWSAFKEATCALLEGEVGIGGAFPKSIAGSQLLCERLEGVMAQYFTLREDIFLFQFQLVDAVTGVIQGNMKQRLAKEIKGKGDVFHASEIIVAYYLMQGKLQSVATLYCDVLEYKNRGQPVSACKTENGLFKNGKLDNLIAYKDASPYSYINRAVYIPTRAAFPGDTGYIDLEALGRGEYVVFKIPSNRTWLQHYHWILGGKDAAVPFVEDLEIFFPPNDKIIAEKKLATTQVEISSIAGSSFLAKEPDQRVQYILPSANNKYLTVYDEGYSLCSDEIKNPYSLCNNLPNICDRSVKVASHSILPTVVSTWKIRLLIHQGSKQLRDALAPATNLLIRGKAKLRIPSRSGRKRRFNADHLFVRSSHSCCDGNKYRTSPHSLECKLCPRGSHSKYRGLYCEIAK